MYRFPSKVSKYMYVKFKFIERITLKSTSNARVVLVKAEQDCFKELFEAVDITRRISEFIWLQ